MKKIKRAISIVSLYLFILTLMPMSFIAKQVQAIENNDKYSYSGEVKYNEGNTWIKNKYNIIGKVLKVEQYVDYSVVVTNENMYIIKDGKARKVALGKASLGSHIIRQGKDIYFTPYYYNMMTYNLLKINLDSTKTQAIPYKGINFSYDYQLQETNTDKNNNNWFSVLQYNYNEKYESSNYQVYKLLRIDAKGKIKELAQLKHNADVHYDEAFTNMSFDKNNNAWFEVSQNNYLAKGKNQYKLGRTSNDGSIKYINFQDAITNYKIADNGDNWVVEGNDKVIKLDKNGKVIKNFITKDTKDIAIDKDGGVWILDENNVKKLEKDKFVTKYSDLKDMNNLSVYASNKIIASNLKGIVIINGKNVEKIVVDNYVKNRAVVVKDNNGKIKILSSASYFIRLYNTCDKTLNVSQILKDGSIKSESIKDAIFYSSELAKGYNDDIYIPYINTIYKLSRAEKQEFAVLFKQQNDDDYEDILNMQIGNTGEIYTVTNKNLYKTDKNGASKSVSVGEISKNSKSSVDRSFYNLLKINNGDLYAFAKEGGNTALYNVKDINNIKEDSNYILNENGEKYYPNNVFVDENDELEFVFLINDEYKIYKKVNNSLVEDSRFNDQDEQFQSLYSVITSVKRSASGNLFVLARHAPLYVKEDNVKYFHEYMDVFINNIEADKEGSIYIGTQYDGLIYYDSKSKITKKN